ncbi:MAG: flavodoxin-like domain-containing protein [Fidelibacterota bacterium]|nr:MAG: flavodoxin-like domain-containing protein [Candidatus Neomarinimicrobiota bacterium]
MNSLVVHFSKFGNTRMVAEAIADSLKTAGTIRLITLDHLTADDLTTLDLLVVGTPTHRMNLPEAVRPLLEALPRRILRKTPVAAFDTSYRMSPFLARFTAAGKLARRLRRLGGKLILPPETFHVKGREGPLYPGERERASTWAESILERLSPGLAAYPAAGHRS